MSGPELSVAIISHQRRRSLHRLLLSLREPVADCPVAAEVVVVLDGSTDGSRELLAATRLAVPLRWQWQARRGRAAARNAVAAAARGQLLWLLDDDVTVHADTLRQHLSAHAGPEDVVAMGPAIIPAGAGTPEAVRDYYDRRHAELATSSHVVRASDFSPANTSLPPALLSRHGGFDEDLVGYGLEDFELAWRLLQADVAIRYLPAAAVTHEQQRTVAALCRDLREEGGNIARVLHRHPEAGAELVAPLDTRLGRALAGARVRSPALLHALARTATAIAVVESRVRPAGHARTFMPATTLSRLSGVARQEPSLLARFLPSRR